MLSDLSLFAEVAMQEAKTRLIYDFQSYFYDQLASGTLARRQRGAIRRMNIKPGQRVLDVGIGTGLSLDAYPRDCHVVGLDLSERMLAKTRQKVARRNLQNVDLLCADAMFCNFVPQSFDHILLSHVISVVSDPVRLIRLAYYLGKPGCRLVIINHFRSANRLMGLFEKLICPLCMNLGWRSDLSLQQLIRSTGLPIDYRYKIEPLDLWETVFARIPDAIDQASGQLAELRRSA